MSQSNGNQKNRANSEAATARAGRERRTDPQSQASQIEKSVTHLLVATKQLLETLTQWSRGAATENEVSDVYVRLGYEFNIACRAFSGVGIETSDLGPVPDTLRSILEETLSQEASQASLDRYLPRIRDIIINLLHGLKRKQQKLRQKTGREGSSSSAAGGDRRQSSVNSSSDSVAAALEGTNRQSMSAAAGLERSMSAELNDAAYQAFPRSASTNTGRTSPSRYGRDSLETRRADSGRGRDGIDDSSITSNAGSGLKDPVTNAPVLEPPGAEAFTPYPPEDNFPSGSISTAYPQPTIMPHPEQTLAPPQPRQPDALTQLQRGGELERRASRRFSAYQISKQLGPSSVQMPMPPPQRSPVPNRGREFRESMQAVKARGSVAQRSRGKNIPTLEEISPNNMQQARNEAATATIPTPILERPATPTQEPGSPTLNVTTESYGTTVEKEKDAIKNRMSAVVTGPPGDDYPAFESEEVNKMTDERPEDRAALVTEPAPIAPTFSDEVTNRPTSIITKPLTLFLQYKTRVKKFVLSEGYQNLTIARLQLAFIEKFAWNTHNNGVDLPEIYLQDQTSGVRYELEDLNDIKDNSVLVLNVNEFDEMKRHFDDGFAGVRYAIDSVKSAMDDQSSSLRRVNESQQEAAKDMARLATTPQAVITSSAQLQTSSPGPSMRLAPGARDVHLRKIDTLRRDLAVMRQTWSSYMEEMNRTAETVKQKASAIAPLAVNASAPDPSDTTASRAYVDAGKKQLGVDSEKIVNRVDDLQDIVEDLRKDVVTRGVRPLPRQLETVNRDIANATSELRKLKDYMKREKPLWTKVGEAELDAVCDDQNVLRNTEDLVADLEDDLDKAAVTFTLVEQATKQQMQQQDKALSTGGQAALRSTSRTLQDKLDSNLDVDPHKAKDGVLGEVRALQPNHESRLEAIERAEKARRAELEDRRDGAFKKELGSFVGEGRLRKTGGVEEAERQRVLKEERARREVWERMNGVILDDNAEGLSGDETGEEAGNRDEAYSPGEQGQNSSHLDGTSSQYLDVQKPEDGTVTPDSEFVEAREGFGEPSPHP